MPHRASTASSACRFTRLDGDPFASLKDVREQLPTHPADRLVGLLPDAWFATQPRRPTRGRVPTGWSRRAGSGFDSDVGFAYREGGCPPPSPVAIVIRPTVTADRRLGQGGQPRRTAGPGPVATPFRADPRSRSRTSPSPSRGLLSPLGLRSRCRCGASANPGQHTSRPERAHAFRAYLQNPVG